ncbi:hypothetical protein LTR05_005970 [Lithohypha guttulata]|uniref:Rhomboid-type serine protease n=1 Tax=Lithohypha guttulata TaxID=1690604 RepID=A0AAN7SWE0_9EURO|nr:hypothetical protein LTR05_005970 [Lithohypha guttulata]
MAAQDYYQPSTHQYQPYTSQPSVPYPQSQYGQAPSYHHNEPLDHRPTPPPPPADLHPSSMYTDDIPLKNQNRVQTNQTEWPAAQHTAYPPSPESQHPDPALLPSSDKKRRRKQKKKGGFFSGKVPWFVYFVSLVQITVFIAEIIKNSTMTGSPIMIKPSFNPMIGPSTYVLINMGARFVPCMRTTYQENSNLRYPESPWPCPNTTSTATTDPNNKCTLGELCGMGGFDYNHPNQWYRFITPIFLHAGIIHIGFNMLLQLTLGRDMEKAIGTVRFMIVYLSSGIFGFVLGGSFAAPAIASTGASGCLFGILALVLLDIFYTWNERPSPGKDLLWLLFDIVISFALGLLPGLDNFSHIGGFLMGLVLGICILHSPSTLRKRIETRGHKPSYSQIGSETNIPTTLASGAIPPTDGKDTTTTTTTTTITRPASLTRFTKQPVSFFKNRKPAWWAWWLIRAGCLIGVLIGFIVLLTNFYKYRDQCSWYDRGDGEWECEEEDG